MDKEEQDVFLQPRTKAHITLGCGRDWLDKVIRNNPDFPCIKVGTRTLIIIPEAKRFIIQAAKEGREL